MRDQNHLNNNIFYCADVRLLYALYHSFFIIITPVNRWIYDWIDNILIYIYVYTEVKHLNTYNIIVIIIFHKISHNMLNLVFLITIY